MGINNEPMAALRNMTVVDLTHVWSGPMCTMMLGDLGAEVIKIESFSGDQYRQPFEGAFFVNFNRNKRSIVLNLKKEEGKEVVLKLAKKADVFVENFLPGVLDRLGLGYDRINDLNPQIVYCSISGFGQDGPYRERPAYDPILQAMSGMMVITGEPERPPVRILPAVIDHCTALYAVSGIIASLLDRERTGKGQRIDIALLDVALTAMSAYATHHHRTGQLPQRYGSAHPGGAPIQAFETRDGYIYISVGTDQMWGNFCKALGLEEFYNNPLYATVQKRSQHRKELAEIVNRITQKYGSQELEEKLLNADVPCGKLQNISEIIQEPHVQSRKILETLNYPPLGEVLTVKSPIFFSGQNAPTRLPPPVHGEHTRDILTELGYGEQEIQEFIDKGIALQYKPVSGQKS